MSDSTAPDSKSPADSKLPRCLLLIGRDKSYSQIVAGLLDSGIEAITPETYADIAAELVRPETFAVFANFKACPDAMQLIRKRETRGQAFWVVIDGRLNTSQSAAIYNLGAADLLTLPVHPFTYRSRARQLLARFARSIGIPDHVVLPAGMPRREAQAARAAGSGPSGTPPPNRIHDLTPDEALEYGVAKSPALVRPPVSLKFHSGRFGEAQILPSSIEVFEKALPQLAPLNDLFGTVMPERRRAAYFQEAERSRQQAWIWIRRQGWKGSTRVIRHDASRHMVAFRYPDGVDAESLKNILQHHGTNELYVSIGLRRARMFFASQLTAESLQADRLWLAPPDSVYQTQRRSHFRLRFEEPSAFQAGIALTTNAPLFNYSVVDLSANGCQLSVDRSRSKLFRPDTACARIVLGVYGRKIECQGVVRWKRGDRVGIQFVSLSKEEEEGLQLFVMEESLAYLKTHVLPE